MYVLSQQSWIVRIAYTFTPHEEMPSQTDRCTLWQRFCLLLIPWAMLNLFAWVLGGVLFGIIGQPVARFLLFMGIGKKLVYNPPRDRVRSIVFARQLIRLCVVYYDQKNIQWLDPLRDKNGFCSPMIMLLGATMLLCMFYLLVSTIPEIFQELSYVTWAVGAFVFTTVGWWGSTLLALVAAGLLYYGVRLGYKAFAATPSGAVIISHFKEWKQQHCEIIKLV